MCAGGLMLRKQLTNREKGAEKTKRVSKRATVSFTKVLSDEMSVWCMWMCVDVDGCGCV